MRLLVLVLSALFLATAATAEQICSLREDDSRYRVTRLPNPSSQSPDVLIDIFRSSDKQRYWARVVDSGSRGTPVIAWDSAKRSLARHGAYAPYFQRLYDEAMEACGMTKKGVTTAQ